MSEYSTPHLSLPNGYQLEEYEILETLGEGGFGVTYKAMDNRLQRLVAIKEYLPGMMASRDADLSVHPRTTQDESQYQWGRDRFLDEARTLAQFRHGTIVSVVRLFEAHGTAYIVMEYEEGQDLGQWLKEKGGFPKESWLREKLLMPLLDGLESVHAKGILHRDIKPSNIYIRHDESPVLLDFGSARQDLGQKTQMLTSVVTAGYSPLEQYGSMGRQGPWTDLYALGGTLYFAMTGTKPPDAVDRIAEDHYVPAAQASEGRYSKALCDAIDQCLRLKGEQRPQSVAELRQRLQVTDEAVDEDRTRVMAPTPQPAAGAGRDASAAPPDKPTLKKGKAPYLLLTGVLVFLVIVGAGIWGLRSLEQQESTAVVKPDAAPVSKPASASHDKAPKAEPDAEKPTPELAKMSPAQKPQPTATQTASLTGQRSTPAQPQANKPTTGNPPEATPTEDHILRGWDISSAIRDARKIQIAGTLVAYIRSRQQFDQCLKQGCSDLAKLKQQLDESRTSPWQHGDVHGVILVETGAQTTLSGCPWRLNVEERITGSAGSRSEKRAYCTSNGFDRKVEPAATK